jgi:hypothetical protein
MRLAVDAANQAGISLKTAETVRRWLDEASDHGAAELDFSAVVATILGLPARHEQQPLGVRRSSPSRRTGEA